MKEIDIFKFQSKEKTVMTFIQNLQDGKVRINSERMSIDGNYISNNNLMDNIKTLMKLKVSEGENYENLIEAIYSTLMDIRLEGYLEGELFYENELQTIHRLKEENKRLKIENERLHNDNVILAGELKDTQNIINRYEKPFVKKKNKEDEHH